MLVKSLHVLVEFDDVKWEKRSFFFNVNGSITWSSSYIVSNTLHFYLDCESL